MASSSRRQSRQPTDVFRPKFPKDPFATPNSKHRDPWYLRSDRFSSLVASQARRDVILVLGAPSQQELTPLLLSKHLSNSLVILATHKTPQIPHTTLPTVRILKLKEPLAIEHAGAVRFVDVLEWAERVARVWRKHGGYGSVELNENEDGHTHLAPPSSLRFYGSRSTPSSPRSSSVQLADETPSPRPRSASARFLSRPLLSSTPSIDPSQRPFDALVNYLPASTSDKALLKQAILATTISRPFLAASSGPAEVFHKPRRLSGFFSSRSSSSVYLPPTPPFQSGDSVNQLPSPPTKSHVIHLLPPDRSSNPVSRTMLVQGLESFILSYAYSDTNADTDMERARPYIMNVHTLGQMTLNDSSGPSNSPYIPWPSECSIADLIFSGSLDDGILPRVNPRAWISGPSDVVLVSDDIPSFDVLVTPPETPPPALQGCNRGSKLRPQSMPHQPPHLDSFSSSHSTLSNLTTSSSFGARSHHSPLNPNSSCHGKRHVSAGMLPTPPDSDESGSEHGSPPSPTKPPGSGRSESTHTSAASTTPLSSPPSSHKSRKLHWKFWSHRSK
ncbi:hypothetical protein C8Q75DRAFT_804849 [Abortiporus biennis]|nr:hypothetical protein C8Q75DRAFT_804849 [Abortiporus biennis]